MPVHVRTDGSFRLEEEFLVDNTVPSAITYLPDSDLSVG